MSMMMMMVTMQRRRLVLPPSLSNSNNGITVLMKGILTALLRNVISFLLVWTMISTQTTQAMMASPHVFFVEQFEDTIGLKIKGDEHEHWVTDIDGKYCTFLHNFVTLLLPLLTTTILITPYIPLTYPKLFF